MAVEHLRADPFAVMRPWRSLFNSKGWWHSFELPDGTRIAGVNTVAGLQQRILQFPIPEDLRGRRVLDIGTWDGWFSFEMERRGADVMAIDTWDNPRFHEVHRLLRSRVDYRQMDVYDLSPKRIGRFDIVLFMGVLYHLKHPLLALERVCAVTTGMAAVDSFILRDEHLPGAEVESRAIMAFYETDEFAGQADNWVGPSLPCLLAFCRTAGFARVEFRGMFAHGACVACYREWEPPTATAAEVPDLADVFHIPNGGINEVPDLADVFHIPNGGINFESERDTYLSAFVDSPIKQLTRDDVMPEVGGYGVRPLSVWQFGEERWQVDFRLPPGLTPGWHDVRVTLRDSRPSKALRIAVDMPFEPGPIQNAGVRDGKTWAPNELDLTQGAALSLWIRGLPDNGDRHNVRVYLADIRLEVNYIDPAKPAQLRQLNVVVPGEIESGVAELVAIAGDQRSLPIEIAIRGGSVSRTQTSYDSIAGEYTKQIYGELKDKPFDQDLLNHFADRVRTLGPVCDLGCGPGQVARYLHDRGVNAFGLDLSANMLTEARRLNSGIQFVRGNMLSLGLRSGSLAGMAAFYSIIHVSRRRVRTALAELRRVLRQGGFLLLAFHLGTDMLYATDFHDQAVDLEITLFTLAEMSGHLEATGFSIEQALEREPYPAVEYQSRRGYILAVREPGVIEESL